MLFNFSVIPPHFLTDKRGLQIKYSQGVYFMSFYFSVQVSFTSIDFGAIIHTLFSYIALFLYINNSTIDMFSLYVL